MPPKTDKDKLEELWEWYIRMGVPLQIVRVAVVVLTVISLVLAIAAALSRMTP